MNKKFFGVAVLASVVISAAAWNFNQGKNEMKLNDLALANVEALARSETDEEFTQKTGCYVVWENVTCHGKDGNTHKYASSSRPY